MIRLNQLVLIFCVVTIALSFKIVDLPYPNNCSNTDQIKATLQHAATFYASNLSSQVSYIKSQMEKSKYPFWEIRIIKDKNLYTFAQMRNGGWPSDACYYTCENCNKLMPDLTYQLIGMSSYYHSRQMVELNSLMQRRYGPGMNQDERNMWTSVVQAADRESISISTKASFISQYIYEASKYIVHSLVIDNENAQFFGSFNSWYTSKTGMYMVYPLGRTTYLIRAV